MAWDPAGKSSVIAKLFNSAGVNVRTTSVIGSSSELHLQVNDLPAGAYFYELLTEGHIARGVINVTR